MAAALCIPAGLALAQTPLPPPHTLPAGTELDFVADDTVSAETVRPGGQYRVHLQHDLVLDGALLAAAGTPARLVVIDRVRRSDGMTALTIAIENFRLKAGALPVAPVTSVVTGIVPATLIPVTTLGSIERTPERVVIRVPVPVPLSTEAPNAAFTFAPYATTAPLGPVRPRNAKPTPLPTTFNPDGDPSAEPASPAPAASASP